MIRYILFFLFIFNISHAVEFIGDFKQGGLAKKKKKTKVKKKKRSGLASKK